MEPHDATGLIVVDGEVVAAGTNLDPSKVETGFNYKQAIRGKVHKALVNLFVPEGAATSASLNQE